MIVNPKVPSKPDDVELSHRTNIEQTLRESIYFYQLGYSLRSRNEFNLWFLELRPLYSSMHFMGGDAASARERFPQHLFDDLAEPPPDVRLAERAAEAFPSRFQGMSAKTGLDEAQSRFVGRSAATLGILGLFAPGLILTGLGTLSLVIFVLIIAETVSHLHLIFLIVLFGA